MSRLQPRLWNGNRDVLSTANHCTGNRRSSNADGFRDGLCSDIVDLAMGRVDELEVVESGSADQGP